MVPDGTGGARDQTLSESIIQRYLATTPATDRALILPWKEDCNRSHLKRSGMLIQ